MPKRDVVVGLEGTKITLGDTTVDVIATPGHTPGTLSFIFPVKDKGRAVVVAYAGGTAFNFPRRAENFAIYRDSQNKFGEAAAAAGATVVMSNHTEFDRAYDRVRISRSCRARGREAPTKTDTATVLRYFDIVADCAEAQRRPMRKTRSTGCLQPGQRRDYARGVRATSSPASATHAKFAPSSRLPLPV